MKRNPEQIDWEQRMDELSENGFDRAIKATLILYKAYMRAFALIDDESFSKEYRKLFADWLLGVGKSEVRENLKLLKELHDT